MQDWSSSRFIEALEKLEEENTLSNGDILTKEPIGVWFDNTVELANKSNNFKSFTGYCLWVYMHFKPSEHTPISAMLYAEILHEAGVPSGVFNLIHGTGEEVGVALSRHPDIQMISFTGQPAEDVSNS